MQFPKGRVDALIGHVLRRCPHVSQQDRQLVFQQVQYGQEKCRLSKKSNGFTTATSSGPVDTGSITRAAGNHHNMILEQQSALDTLAEVSRRHLDYSTYRPQADLGEFSQRKSLTDEGHALAEQALIASLQQHVVGSNYAGQMDSDNAGHSMPGSVLGPETLHPISPSFESQAVYQTAAPTSNLDHCQHEHFHSPPLQIETGIRQGEEAQPPLAPLDPKLDDVTMGIESHLVRQLSEENDMTWSSEMTTSLDAFDSLADSPTGHKKSRGFDTLHKVSNRRRRGVFSESRREEVKANRKRGACLRCRMLKKSCSEGTPCSTCSSIETARVWKDTCIRTRIVDIVPLWSVALYHRKAKAKISAAVDGLVQAALPGRLEISFCAESDLCLTFTAKQYTTKIPQKERNLELSLLDELPHRPKAIWLLDEDEEMTDKIEEYVSCISDSYIQAETTGCIKALLREARSIVREETLSAANGQQNEAGDPENASLRSCYSLQDQLPKCMVQLWVYTRVLSSPIGLPLRIQYNATQSPRQQPSHFEQPKEVDEHNLQAVPTNSHTYELIRNQLLALIEARCIKLSRIAMNEMERRLLQRRQVSRKATFISALVLLNCVERTTSFFQGFAAASSVGEGPVVVHDEDIAAAFVTQERTLRFQRSLVPFFHPCHLSSTLVGTTIDKLWLQGESFANLLIMMLRLRGLTPKTICDTSSHLSTVYGLTRDVQSKTNDDHSDNRALSEWLNPIHLNVEDLISKRDGPLPSLLADPLTWDMQFISRVLIPEYQK
nr:hypothetical protein CFP56_32430 [Quercus suber]